MNRARPEDSEPVRRLDEGATRIALSEWGSEKWFPRGWWGEWKREHGEWVYHPDPRDPDGDPTRPTNAYYEALGIPVAAALDH